MSLERITHDPPEGGQVVSGPDRIDETIVVIGEKQDDFETQCWGWPFPLNGPLTSPNYTPPGDQTESVSVGSTHACLISLDGAEAQAECFGSNTYGKATPPVLSGRCPLRLRIYEPRIPIGGFSLGG